MNSGAIAIVGAGQAGGRAAEALRRRGFEERIYLIGEEPRAPYERPPLSKSVLTGNKSPETCALFDERFYTASRIELVTGRKVARIDASSHRLEFADKGTLSFGQLLLCTGGRVRTLPAAPPGRVGVHYLRTVEDSLALGDALRRTANVVVIGGGFLGLEVASSARTLGVEVTVLEEQPRVLARAVAPQVAEAIVQLHRHKGVRIRTGVKIGRLVGERAVRAIEIEGTSPIATDLVVVAIGIIPEVDLAARAGAHIDNGVVVDACCRTSLPGVFAAGDIANHPNDLLGQRLRLESWQNAQNQAIAAAGALCGRREPYRELPWFWSDQHGTNVQIVGMPLQTDRVVRREGRTTGSCMFFNLHAGTVVGATAVNMGGEMRHARQMIAERVSIRPELLSDPSVSLREISRGLSAHSDAS